MRSVRASARLAKKGDRMEAKTLPESTTLLNRALHELDETLRERTELHVLGGYALSYHGIRPPELLTDDIDVSGVIDAGLERAVRRVATRLGLERDWLNNDVVYAYDDEATQDDVDALDAMLDARYDPVPTDFENISIWMADMPTLTKAKAFATEDIGRGRTTKDLDDLVRLLSAQTCDDMPSAIQRFPWLSGDEFQSTRRRLTTAFRARRNALRPHGTETARP